MSAKLFKSLSTLCLFALMQTNSFARIIHKIPKQQDVIKTISSGVIKEIPFDIQNDDELNILVWNMYKGKNDTWEEDFRTLSSDKNIIIAQEMFLDHKMENVFETNGNFEYITATSFYVWGKTRTGVVTAGDSRLIDYTFLRSEAREPVVNTPKVALVTKHLLSNGKVLLVANIHAVNFVSSKSLKKQLEQIAGEILTHTGPVIFAGDFNVWTDKKTKILRNIMSSLGLTEVVYEKKDDQRMKFNKHVLDYIFYRGIEFVESQVHGHINGSDHKPLTAKFKIE